MPIIRSLFLWKSSCRNCTTLQWGSKQHLQTCAHPIGCSHTTIASLQMGGHLRRTLKAQHGRLNTRLRKWVGAGDPIDFRTCAWDPQTLQTVPHLLQEPLRERDFDLKLAVVTAQVLKASHEPVQPVGWLTMNRAPQLTKNNRSDHFTGPWRPSLPCFPQPPPNCQVHAGHQVVVHLCLPNLCNAQNTAWRRTKPCP